MSWQSALLQYTDSNNSTDDESEESGDCQKDDRVESQGDPVADDRRSALKCPLKTVHSALKRKHTNTFLPLPTSVLKLYPDRGDKNDSLDDHQGRKRTFDHVAGDWPSSVFTPGNVDPSCARLINSLVAAIQVFLPGTQAIAQKDQHMSLSRTVSFRHYWIDPIVEKLRKSFKEAKRFVVYCDEIEVYTNDEKTRSFFALKTRHNLPQLKRLVGHVDTVLQSFGLQVYYRDPSFHVSFAWHLDDIVNTVKPSRRQELQGIIDDCRNLYSSGNPLEILVDEIVLRTGNQMHRFPLQP